MSGDEDEPDLSGDEEELLLQDSDDEADEIEIPGKKQKGKPKLKLKGKDDLGSLFASAEEFSTLLEETASNKKQGSSQAVSNTDNSSHKQLAWEEKRDTWIKGYNRKILGNKKAGKGRKFNKNKQNGGFNKMTDSKKGGKRKGGNADGGGGKKKKFK
ncbi:CCAAT/enhancer-binding protein zeta-like [Ostrinia nubilalis]|uniref:CCAAT/enhancer-binding protein zeta-like n=1 Tax=Ostrinia nubilalis TaxID=29057 RepID=UPI003082310D